MQQPSALIRGLYLCNQQSKIVIVCNKHILKERNIMHLSITNPYGLAVAGTDITIDNAIQITSNLENNVLIILTVLCSISASLSFAKHLFFMIATSLLSASVSFVDSMITVCVFSNFKKNNRLSFTEWST